jgi:hypothetical protein
MAWVILGIVVVAVVLLGAVGARMQRSRALRRRFGPEYERTAERAGGNRAAEAELRRREKRREQLEIRSLTPEAQRRYAIRWREVQAQFVDQPASAVSQADLLVGEAMRERGYPVEEFDQRAADVSVDHPDVAENYRAAHTIALANRTDGATTEDLRQAMVHYRALFDRLIEVEPRVEAHR